MSDRHLEVYQLWMYQRAISIFIKFCMNIQKHDLTQIVETQFIKTQEGVAYNPLHQCVSHLIGYPEGVKRVWQLSKFIFSKVKDSAHKI